MNWQDIVITIIDSKNHGVLSPDGEPWTYVRIGKKVKLSKSTIGRMALGHEIDPLFTPGMALIKLFQQINQEVKDNGSRITTNSDTV